MVDDYEDDLVMVNHGVGANGDAVPVEEAVEADETALNGVGGSRKPKREPLPPYFLTFTKHFLAKRPFSSDQRNVCLKGQLKATQFRNLIWAHFLGALPDHPAGWEPALRTTRSFYAHLLKKYAHDERHNPELSPEVNNPLSQDESSPWTQFFADKELVTCIKRDVERTSPDVALFRRAEVQRQLTNILFVYCKENPRLSYKQGMHEVLASIYLMLQGKIG